MSVTVFIGFDEDVGELQGIIGDVDSDEYELLTTLSNACMSQKIMSLDELQSISDDRNDLANIIIKRYFKKNESISDERERMEREFTYLCKLFDSYDEYRSRASPLDFLLSLSIITVDHKNDREIWADEEADSLDGVFTLVDSDIRDAIEKTAFKHIQMAPELFEAYYEFFWIHDGLEIVDEAGLPDDDKDALETEILWFKENMDHFFEEMENGYAFLMLRAIRNNVLKNLVTGESNLIHRDWIKKITVM